MVAAGVRIDEVHMSTLQRARETTWNATSAATAGATRAW
ncbi:hypothetical protein [Streptomyces sp. NPDC002156]